MVTLDELLDIGEAKRSARGAMRKLAAAAGAGLYWTGWALFHAVRLALLAVGAVFWTLGWVTRRAVWPALVWCAAAVKLGWEDGAAGRRAAGETGGARVPR